MYIPISTDDSYQHYLNLKGLREVLDKAEIFLLVSVCYGGWIGVWSWGGERSSLGKLPQSSGETLQMICFFHYLCFLMKFLIQKVNNLVISSKPGYKMSI